MIELVIGGIAATYMHKRFPKQTEAVARGIVRGSGWVIKKAAQAIASKPNVPAPDVRVISPTRGRPRT